MKRDDLYLLVHRLSKQERTYVSKRLSTFKDNSTLKSMFEDICTYDNLLKAELDKKIAEKYAHYKVRKKELYYKILEILRDYHPTLLHKIHFYILDINLLFEKGLFEAARKLLKKAKLLADRNQIVPLYLQLLYLELRMSYYTYYDNLTPEIIQQMQKDFSKYYHILKEDIDQAFYTTQQLRAFFQEGYIPPLQPIKHKLNGHLAYIQQHILQGFAYRSHLFFEESYKYRLKLWEYFNQHTELILLYPELYLTAINMVIIGANDLGKYEQSLSILNQLSNHPIQADIARIEVFRIQATYYTQTYNFMEKYHIAYENIENYLKNPFYNEIHQWDKQLLHLHFVVACLAQKDFHKTIYFCHQILNIQGNMNVMSLAFIFLIIAHLLQGNTDVIRVIKQQYKEVRIKVPFYSKILRVLSSSKKLNNKLQLVLSYYESSSIESRFVWEKYVRFEKIILKCVQYAQEC
ncbi:MAG: hypothetical protein NZ519_10275 [Bacteroidia bacterium]|nr:hypothetical protein [Bacteroidia bacterium]MDW8301560.1 hypothetical protein [Bacteroidia bacterium]